MTRLPPELTDYIIDHLHYERRTLSSCSLVCRNWLPSCRHHRFHRTRIYNMKDVESLIDLLNSPLCTITNHVVYLQIDINGTQAMFDLMIPYFDRFTSIASLSLCNTQWDLVSKAVEENLSRMPARVMKMDLTSIYSCATLIFTLGDFGNVDSHTFLSRLRSLHPVIDGKVSELSWLLDVALFPAITDFHLSGIKRKHMADMQVILRQRGPSIHFIRLGFESDIVAISELLDLSPITNLRSVAIRGLNFQDALGNFAISRIFSNISSLSLTEITISISLDTPSDAHRVDWKELAEVLNRPQFSQLQKVWVYLYGNSCCGTWVRKEMSSLADSRGLLFF